MKVAYFDCFSGASGDMILGAMIDAGLSPRALREELEKLRVSGLRLKKKKVLRAGIAGTQVLVERKSERRVHRNLKEVLSIIERSELGPEVKEKSKAIFQRIANAEAKIHHLSVDEVHFHELGGLDSVVDIVGSILGLQLLGVDEVWVSRVNVGGWICDVRARNFPCSCACHFIPDEGEAHLLLGHRKGASHTHWSSGFDDSGFQIWRDAYHGGREDRLWAGRDDLPHPNLLRLMIGSSLEGLGKERVSVIETNIDDMNPQLFDHIIEGLFKRGALDVFLTSGDNEEE